MDCKTREVIPIYKSDDMANPCNYRPISLTLVSCRTMEHVIYSHLACFLEDKVFFTSYQHGFHKKISFDTQLLLFTNNLHYNVDYGFLIDSVFLDFAKAFHKVNHCLLLHKQVVP